MDKATHVASTGGATLDSDKFDTTKRIQDKNTTQSGGGSLGLGDFVSVPIPSKIYKKHNERWIREKCRVRVRERETCAVPVAKTCSANTNESCPLQMPLA